MGVDRRTTMPRRGLLLGLLALCAKGATAGALGKLHSCAIYKNGPVRKVQCWGDNTYGQLGDGTTNDSSIPVDVLGITTAASVALGTDHSCVVLTDGTLKCSGWNAHDTSGTRTGHRSTRPLSTSLASRTRRTSLVVFATRARCSRTVR